MRAKTLVDMLRAAGRDERLSTGALYLEAADEIEHFHAALLAAKRGHTRECLAHHFPCTCGTDFHNAAIDEALGNG